jgi:hypothetical protein
MHNQSRIPNRHSALGGAADRRHQAEDPYEIVSSPPERRLAQTFQGLGDVLEAALLVGFGSTCTDDRGSTNCTDCAGRRRATLMSETLFSGGNDDPQVGQDDPSKFRYSFFNPFPSVSDFN